jgi:predicted RNA-binding Zn ribbon-like protein
MPRSKPHVIRVRGTTWGLRTDLDFLEYVAARLNGINGERVRWLHVSDRRPNPLQRDVVGGTARRARARIEAAQSYSGLCALRAILAPAVPLTPAPARLPSETLRRFQILESRHPARLSLAHITLLDGGPEVEATIPSAGENEEPLSHVVFTVWRLLGLRERDRLKRCAHCLTWFVDRMRSKRKIWCSAPCHDAAWNRAARRGANHDQYRKKQQPTARTQPRKRDHR